MNFRYDIGFLRAIAVISVLFFHFKIDLFSVGFVGVDVFFVISGYLMTRIILKGFSKNKFSLGDFYMRRVKRIIPLLIVVGFSILIVSSVFKYVVPIFWVLVAFSLLSSFLINKMYQPILKFLG